MKKSGKYIIVYVTAPDIKVARRIAKEALQARLVACVNIVPEIESHYWWQGKIEFSSEVLMIMKTQKNQVLALEKLVLEKHPYETPEFIVVDIVSGNERYLNWITDSLKKM